MKNIRYFDVPQWGAVFKVQEDCCFEKVVYDGKILGVTEKNDEEGDFPNSYNLWCCNCNPGIKIIPISQQRFLEVKAKVVDILENAA